MNRILLVEDDKEGADAICQYLEFRGFSVDSVSSGEAAMAAVAARKDGHHYDVVITDLHLPGMRGDELAARLAGQEGPTPKLIAISGEHGPIGRARFDARLPKPCQPKIFVEAIGKLLAQV